jgi:hypothetical protein
MTPYSLLLRISVGSNFYRYRPVCTGLSWLDGGKRKRKALCHKPEGREF